jgi:hypothetical protein
MNVNTLSNNERETLLTTFRLFRAHDIEDDYRGYSHCDEIERKLQQGGTLDDEETHLLAVAVVNELTDDGTIDALLVAIGEDK